MQNREELPPFVRFEMDVVEDWTTGKQTWRDVAFAHVTRPGQRDTLVKNAEQWLKDLAQRVDQGLAPQVWLDHFTRQYEAWKKGNEVPETGTPLKSWPMISKGQLQALLDLHIRTVEDLAALDEAGVSRVGMGAVALRERAREFLKAQQTGVTVAELESLRGENARLQAAVEKLQAMVDAQKKVPA